MRKHCEYKIRGKRQSDKMNKRNQYNIKDYINSFNTKKKIAIYLSVSLLLFHLLSIIIYLIERTDITILTESNIISIITSMLTISFSISKILDVYLFLFPIFFIIFNFLIIFILYSGSKVNPDTIPVRPFFFYSYCSMFLYTSFSSVCGNFIQYICNCFIFLL